MADLDHDVAAELLKIQERKQAQRAAEAPAAIEPEPSPEAAPVEVPEVQVDQTAEAESNTDPKEVEPPKETQKQEEEPDGEIKFDWDVDKDETPTSLDLKKIGSALNLEVSNEEEFVKTVNEKFTKLKEYEEKSSSENNLPPEFKQTFDEVKQIAAQGGDWQSYIYDSLVDPTKLDPIKLFESEFEKANAARFRTPEGGIDYEALYAEHDQIPEGIRKMQGAAIQNQLISAQQQRKQALQQQMKQSYDNFSKNLAEATKSLPDAFPQEVYGLKFDSKHAAAFNEGILNGKLVQKHLGNVDISMLSKLDAAKIARTIAKAEIAEQAAQYNRKLGRSEGKRELLEKTQNPQIQTPGKAAAPETPDHLKKKTAAEQLKDMLTRYKPENSL